MAKRTRFKHSAKQYVEGIDLNEENVIWAIHKYPELFGPQFLKQILDANGFQVPSPETHHGKLLRIYETLGTKKKVKSIYKGKEFIKNKPTLYGYYYWASKHFSINLWAIIFAIIGIVLGLNLCSNVNNSEKKNIPITETKQKLPPTKADSTSLIRNIDSLDGR